MPTLMSVSRPAAFIVAQRQTRDRTPSPDPGGAPRTRSEPECPERSGRRGCAAAPGRPKFGCYVERDHVGDRAERHQIEQFRGPVIGIAQLARQCGHDVEGHPDSRQGAAAERGAGRLGSRSPRPAAASCPADDGPSPAPGSQRARRFDALDAGHAVVDGHHQRGPARRRESDDLGRQPVTEVDRSGTRKSTWVNFIERRARTISALLVAPSASKSPTTKSAPAMRRQQLRRGLDALERTHRQQPLDRQVQSFAVGDAARA